MGFNFSARPLGLIDPVSEHTRGIPPSSALIKGFASLCDEILLNQSVHGGAPMAIAWSNLGAYVGSGSFQRLRSVEWLPAVQCTLICSLVL